jgi:nitrogen fixation-related uncharacterized protein
METIEAMIRVAVPVFMLGLFTLAWPVLRGWKA